MEKKTQLLMTAAIAGIVGATLVTPSYAMAKGKTKGMMLCPGESSCKGKGGCGEAKGKNECKGQGMAMMSKADCEAKGKTPMAAPKMKKM